MYGGYEISCTKAGPVGPPEGLDYDGEFDCPDIDLFCSYFDRRCPFDCYGHGICLKVNAGYDTIDQIMTFEYQCFCLEGYTGLNCNTCTTCTDTTDPFILCQDVTPGNPALPCKSKIVSI